MFVLFLLFVVSLFGSDVVVGGSSVVLLCDFDDVATGLDDFESGYFECNNTGTVNRFQTSSINDLSAPNSLQVGSVAGVATGRINLTSVIDYIGSVNFSFVFDDQGADTIHMRFYDVYDNLLIHMEFQAGTMKFVWEDVTLGDTDIGSIVDDTRFYVVFTHLGTNQFNISLYDNVFVFVDGDALAGKYAGNWENFSYITFETTGGSILYIDNFYIGVGGGSSECYELNDGYDSVCSGTTGVYAKVMNHHKYVESEFVDAYTGTIYGVDLPISLDQYNTVSDSVGDYWMYINGVPCGNPVCVFTGRYGYILRWYNEYGFVILDNEKPLFSFYCDEHNSVGDYWVGIGINPSFGRALSSEHSDYDKYIDNVYNGYVLKGGKVSLCYYIDLSIDDNYKKDIPVSDLDDYIDLYGDEFFEFKYNDVTGPECYYGIGYNPIIVYNLSDDYFTDTDLFYTYRIYKVGLSGYLYQGIVHLADVYEAKEFTVTDFMFNSVGGYYLMLYNTTGYGTVFNSSSGVVYRSHTVTVCVEGVGPKGPGGGSDVNAVDDYMSKAFVVAGFVVFAVMLCIGAFIGSKIKSEKPASIVTSCFGGSGLVMAVGFGLWELWSALVMCLVLIVVIALIVRRL